MSAGTEGRSLYAINQELTDILSMMASEGYDQATVDGALDEWLEGSRGEIEAKIDDYCAVIRTHESLAEMRKQEAVALRAMASADEAIVERLKDRCKEFFDRIGVKKMETMRFKPRVCANGGATPLVLSDEVKHDPSKLPVEYLQIKYEIQTTLIRHDLENGVEIEGATLGERGSHFRLR